MPGDRAWERARIVLCSGLPYGTLLAEVVRSACSSAVGCPLQREYTPLTTS